MVNHQEKQTGIMGLVTSRKRRLLFFFILLGILGAWLNAQGGWVKDFSYNRVVVLPFLFNNYTTTGFNWYLAGIFDDLLGFTANLVGIYGFKKLANMRLLDVYSRKYFLLPIIVYLATDFLAFLNFNSYYQGITSISDYGIYWNVFQYFLMLPAFVLSDSFLILYDTGRTSTEAPPS